VLVFLVAARLGWAAWEFVFRHYGPGRTTGALLLEASPAAAAVAWLATTAVVAAVGLLLVRVLRGTLG
jgi:hypothetical protein